MLYNIILTKVNILSILYVYNRPLLIRSNKWLSAYFITLKT